MTGKQQKSELLVTDNPSIAPKMMIPVTPNNINRHCRETWQEDHFCLFAAKSQFENEKFNVKRGGYETYCLAVKIPIGIEMDSI